MIRRILVVDNDRFCVRIVDEFLSQAGYEVVRAYDGMEAMEAMERELPDAVLLDIVMPKIDGDRLFRYMRANARTRHIPVVVLSGTLVEDRERLLVMGADAYVAKGRRDDMRQNILAALERLDHPPAQPPPVLGLESAMTRELVKELLAIKRHKEAILQAVGEGVVEADGRQRVLYLNPTALTILGRPELELIGSPVTEILTSHHQATLQQIVARFLARAGTKTEAVSLRFRDLVLRIGLTGVVPHDPEGGFFLILQDITDLSRKIVELSTLNTRLQEMERARSEFLAMISHDLHTPLTAITGSLEVLLRENLRTEQGRELLGIAQKHADRLFRMVSDILDLARIEAGRFSIRCGPFDVVDALRVAMDRLRRSAQEKEITLTLSAPDGIAPVYADGLRMEQVINNLLGNALKFTPPGGRISVTVGELATELLVGVEDTGMGVPEEHRDRIFDRFYRVPLPAGMEVEGTGLGLSICKAIVEEHGGRIWVESAVPRGSTFAFTLPKGSPAS